MTVQWRNYLKPSEIPEVEELDREIEIARASDRKHTAMREKIRRRCVGREGLAKRKAGK